MSIDGAVPPSASPIAALRPGKKTSFAPHRQYAGGRGGPYHGQPDPLPHDWVQPQQTISQATSQSQTGTPLQLTALVDPMLSGTMTFHAGQWQP